MAIVDELVTIIGLRVDSGTSQQVSGFSRSIGNLIKKTAELGTGLTIAAAGISAYAVALASTIDSQGKFADSLGVSVEDLQALGYAAGISGGSIETISADLKTLSQIIDTSNPGSYSEALLQLGVSARKSNGEIKNSTELLLDLSDKFVTLSQKQAVDFGEKIGLDESTIRLLQTGREGVNALTNEAAALGGVLSNTAANDAADFNDALLRLRFGFFGIINTVTSKFFPIFTKIADKISGFVKANKKWIDLGIDQVLNGVIDGFKLFKDSITAVIDKIQDLLPDTFKFKGALDATKLVAVVVASALTSLAGLAVVAAAPFLLAATAVTGLFIVIEDLYSFIDGNDSVIGDFVNAFANKFPNIAKVVRATVDSVKEFFSNAIDFLISDLKQGLDFFKQVGSALGVSIFEGLESLDKSLAAPTTAPTPASIVQQTSAANSVSNNTTVNQNIFGAGDPRAVGQQVVERGGFANIAQQATPGFFAPISQ